MFKTRYLKTGLLLIALVLCLPTICFSSSEECKELNSTIPGTYTPLPPLFFVEEWDNGLTGNHPWVHTTAADNPDNGETANSVADDLLIKNNTRYAGYATPRYNESYIALQDTYYPGLFVTPVTDIEFKIDELSINEQPPAPEGETTAWQGFWLHFNDGLSLQFSQDGQFVALYDDTGYYTFELEADNTGNIYTLFQDAEITIPEPLFLEYIQYYQQLWDLEDPSTVDHIQDMEADYVRILFRWEDLF